MTAFISVDLRAEAVLARFRGMSAKLRSSLTRVITRLSIELQTKVKDEKLSGQVLHVQTGTLRRSINRRVDVDGDTIRAQVGTNVPYAHVHEYGYVGTENVRAHTRHLANGTIANVRAFTRTVNIPETSFLRSSLDDMADDIRAQIRAAAREGLAA